MGREERDMGTEGVREIRGKGGVGWTEGVKGEGAGIQGKVGGKEREG
jgi:hypothetical protein